LSIAPKAATPHTMDIRKRRRIVDDEEDDDSEDSNDIDRPIIDVDEDDDDSEDEDDDDDGDYDEDEDDDDEASNDVDDDEVVDKSSNPPGINDSLAFSNKGGEKRSGSIVVNVEQGCNAPPPPPPTRAGAGAGAGADLTRPRSSGGARPHPPPRGGRRGGDRMLPVSCGVASVHLEEELIHNRISGTRGGGKIKEKRVGILHPPPLMAVLSVVIQVQTQLVPMNLPHLFLEMSDLKPFPKMTLTMNICAHIAGQSIRLVVMTLKIHRFLFSYADIDFAEIASMIWGGGRIVP
jgi:hypothetical protein